MFTDLNTKSNNKKEIKEIRESEDTKENDTDK